MAGQVCSIGRSDALFPVRWLAIALLLTTAGVLLPGHGVAQGATDQGSVAERLQALVEVGLHYAEHDIEARQRALGEAKALLAAQDAPLPQLRAQYGLADAYLRYQTGDLSGAIEAARTSLTHISLASHPDDHVRSRSLLGGLLLAQGHTDEGLRMFETLFADNLSAVPPMRVENARVNYASALVQVGRIEDAGRAYEQALLYALTHQEDLLGLAAGANYVSLLNKQGMSGEAQYWLTRLEPAMARLPTVMSTAALKIYQLGIAVRSGASAGVLRDIEALLAQSTEAPKLVRAHARELYAEALRQQGQNTAALREAQAALALLEGYPVERPDALIAMARAHLALNDVAAAGRVISGLEGSEFITPSNRVELHELRLEQALLTGDTEAAARALKDFRAANEAQSSFVNERQVSYFQDKLSTQRTALELRLSQEAAALLRAEAATQQAQANEATMRAQALRRERGFIIGIVALIALGAVALIYFNARRQLHSKLRARLRQQNESLSALVDAKSADLVRNVTEQAQLKAALDERRHMEAIGQIAGHVAHDFNNVMQVVSSANDVLAPLVRTSTQQKALSAAQQSIHAASATVRQLLAYSRNQQLEATVFGIGAFMTDNQHLFRSAIGEVNQLQLDHRAEDAHVRLDRGQFTASIINLLRNAADAMTAPGDITLRTQRNEANGSVAIAVIDTGRGMDEAEAARALEPYYSTKNEEAGTGLGLSSVFGFVTQSGGEMTIDSVPGEGTVVSLRFPLQAPIAPQSTSTPAASSLLAQARVLLVEDNPLIASTLQTLLESTGASVVWSDNADNARTRVSDDGPFDLMLTDIKIPGATNGLGLAEWVQTHFPQIRIGMMSGFGSEAGTGNPIPVLSKPFTRDEL
ncbi:MAG: ATP-binding protein, partial [Pseudomonadota bacterium]